MTPFQEAIEAVETLSEIFNSSLYDVELLRWRKIVEPVYIEADVGWCIRHDDVLVRHSNPAVCNTHLRYLATPFAHHPVMFPDHDPGRCVPVALYRQAEDP